MKKYKSFEQSWREEKASLKRGMDAVDAIDNQGATLRKELNEMLNFDNTENEAGIQNANSDAIESSAEASSTEIIGSDGDIILAFS